MAKKQYPISNVLVDICMKKAKKERKYAERWRADLTHRLYKAIEAGEQQDFPVLAVELAKLAGIALSAAEMVYTGGETSC